MTLNNVLIYENKQLLKVCIFLAITQQMPQNIEQKMSSRGFSELWNVVVVIIIIIIIVISNAFNQTFQISENITTITVINYLIKKKKVPLYLSF